MQATAAYTFISVPIREGFLGKVRSTGRDDQDQEVVRLAAQGGEPLRDQLRRALPGELIILASYCPFLKAGPYREYGPIFVASAEGPMEAEWIFVRRTDAARDYFKRRVALRAYSHSETIMDALIVETELARTTIDLFLRREGVAFVDARFPTYGCFGARFAPGTVH